MMYFWLHNIYFLTPWHTFWHYDIFFESWHMFWRHDLRFWYNNILSKLIDVMMLYLMQWCILCNVDIVCICFDVMKYIWFYDILFNVMTYFLTRYDIRKYMKRSKSMENTSWHTFLIVEIYYRYASKCEVKVSKNVKNYTIIDNLVTKCPRNVRLVPRYS